MFIVPLLLVGALSWYLVVLYKWKKNVFDLLEKIPGGKYYPIIGTSWEYFGATRDDLLYRFVDVINKYGPIFRTWNGNTPELNIHKPEHLQVVMRSSTHIRKDAFYKVLYDWLGNGLLTSNGAIWFLQRKLMTPAFHFKILENFMEIFADNAKKLTDRFEVYCKEGKSFNLVKEITDTTLDVICETAMGIPSDKITNNKQEYINALYDQCDVATWRYFTPYFNNMLLHLLPEGKRFRDSMKILHGFSSKVISERKRLRMNTPQVEEKTNDDEDCGTKKRLSFLDLAINAADAEDSIITDRDLQSLVDTFLFGGFDTTTNSTCWTLFLLGNYPEVQEKVYQEVKRAIGDKPIPTTLAEINEMRYMECCIKEALRMYPVLPFVTRVLSEDIELDGYKVPSGTQVLLHLGKVHKDPEYYPEPDKFMPERFLPENSKGRHPFAYVPFSAGPRNCIGQRFALSEEKTLISAILQKYKLISLETPEEKRLLAQIVVRANGGIKVRLERRNE